MPLKSITLQNIAYTQNQPQPTDATQTILDGKRARWPVWSVSTTREVKFTRLSKSERWNLWNAAQEFDAKTRGATRGTDKIGRVALAVFRVLLFEFKNQITGRLDPSRDAIARVCNYSVRAVDYALAKLRAAGLIDWLRRAERDQDEFGRFRLRQISNAYGLIPVAEWFGFRRPAPPPAAAPGVLAITTGQLYFGPDDGSPVDVGGELKRIREKLAQMHGYSSTKNEP